MSLIAKFAELNDADLSKLSDRLAKLRAEMERGLIAKGENPNRAITPADLQAASQQTGLTAEQLLKELQRTQRSAA